MLSPDEQVQARSIAQKLQANIEHGGAVVPTLASALHFRNERISWLREALRNFPENRKASLRTFTIISKDWRYAPDELEAVDPDAVLDQLRQHLRRSDVAKIPGFLVAFLYGEFEPTANRFQLHVHGVATATRALALNRLNRHWGYAKQVLARHRSVSKR